MARASPDVALTHPAMLYPWRGPQLSAFRIRASSVPRSRSSDCLVIAPPRRFSGGTLPPARSGVNGGPGRRRTAPTILTLTPPGRRVSINLTWSEVDGGRMDPRVAAAVPCTCTLGGDIVGAGSFRSHRYDSSLSVATDESASRQIGGARP